MAKITRKTQKIFAGQADSNKITAFATAKTSNPVYTSDVAAIQTSAFTQGWTPSLMSDLAPYLQDSNGLWYVVTSQLAYLFQQGIAEWDSGTEYAQNSIVANGSKIYVSKTNANIGNAITDTTYWAVYDLDTINKPYLKTSYVNGTAGYNIWSNGYCEQWGAIANAYPATVTLLKTYKDKNYNIMQNVKDGTSNSGANQYYQSCDVLSSNSFQIKIWGIDGHSPNLYWCTKGYLAEGQY